ncbi:AAA family ATPase [Blastococcus sp. KM273129]|uniref:AAA family ATPase n=1 Tax=Blastococcus sp. KM273129 TaxID=2570315 RepID=UPI001F3D3909|nr:AAA family ATPase [Blastococcus sp. KM273129]MCF6735230.1 hypothetical protein [Blastococcus sp. KM273129]
MATFVMSTNCRVFAQIDQGFIAWKRQTGEADFIGRMQPGDFLVAKFAQDAVYGEEDAATQRAYCENLGVDFDTIVAAYETLIQGGKGAVPYVLRVVTAPHDDDASGEPMVRVSVDVEDLDEPISTQEFLRLRALPDAIAAQFKGTVGRGRHIQEIDGDGLVAAVRAAGRTTDRDHLLRRFSLVDAQTPEDAVTRLTAAGRHPREGDMAFLVTRAMMPGLCSAEPSGALVPAHAPIAQSPESALALLEDAQRRASANDPFAPRQALAAMSQIRGFLDEDDRVLAIDDYTRFYDRYRLLSVKITQALALAKKPLPADVQKQEVDQPASDGSTEVDDAATLAGLSVEAVVASLPEGFSIDREVIAAAVTALRAGKHLLLGGPPGSGKTTLGEALCRAVVGAVNYSVTTATADWTTFDTIGGYIPTESGNLRFTPGVVLRALRDGHWLLIDEVNRADIDKAFGPLFTVLSGGDSAAAGRRSILPYTDDGMSVAIEWVASREGSAATYPLTGSWRLIGTLNVSDKASLFRLSFAFLRRFAVIDVPLPKEDEYRNLLTAWLAEAPEQDREPIAEALLNVCCSGPVPIGPAIAQDVARFVVEASAPTASGAPSFDVATTALAAGIRLLVVPQYEGAPPADGKALVALLDKSLPSLDADARAQLVEALEEVALS